MKAMIFAAGLGTRLRPLTDHLPKALVKVGGRPMLEHVILKLKAAGFDDITVNIHYLGEQIIDFLKANDNFGVSIHISDERGKLLDTGGGIKKARTFLAGDNEPFLIHNADILSNVDLKDIYRHHVESGREVTLLVSRRETSRYLIFDHQRRLQGWINKKTGETKPAGFVYDEQQQGAFAFTGIHVLSPSIYRYMDEPLWGDKFSIIDFYTQVCPRVNIGAFVKDDLQLCDIGKPETLAEAEQFINQLHS
jgi:MurNAc alpha-1-phosphate uridylyltransferase